jgi:hypothetical protein
MVHLPRQFWKKAGSGNFRMLQRDAGSSAGRPVVLMRSVMAGFAAAATPPDGRDRLPRTSGL